VVNPQGEVRHLSHGSLGSGGGQLFGWRCFENSFDTLGWDGTMKDT
jgi:hypothetical protein